MWLLQGQSQVAPLPVREAVVAGTNTAQHRPRVNRMVRTPIESARIVRLGHVVLQTVDFPRMADWYLQVLGLIPTDVQYLADGSPNLAFCRLNLGEQPADHHTVVLVGGIEDKYAHSAYEVVDLDALGQGQQVLRAHGYRHMWGIGRHLLGSQLFDYWFDPDGFEYEHYTDGDLFTADFETAYSPLEFGGIWTWGDDAPASMKPKKNLRNLVHVLGLLRRKAITLGRLKLLSEALDATRPPLGLIPPPEDTGSRCLSSADPRTPPAAVALDSYAISAACTHPGCADASAPDRAVSSSRHPPPHPIVRERYQHRLERLIQRCELAGRLSRTRRASSRSSIWK